MATGRLSWQRLSFKIHSQPDEARTVQEEISVARLFGGLQEERQ